MLIYGVKLYINHCTLFRLQALGLYAAVPALWLILTLFILLVYLLTRCCDRNPRRKRSISPWKWILGLLAVICW
jgi:protein tweety